MAALVGVRLSGPLASHELVGTCGLRENPVSFIRGGSVVTVRPIQCVLKLTLRIQNNAQDVCITHVLNENASAFERFRPPDPFPPIGLVPGPHCVPTTPQFWTP